MDLIFLGIVIFLFLLAIFDLSVGVSNDAVNFLSSAVGSKAATFKRVMTVAAIGVFIGAALSNGMMDIARHGIFRPENLSFYDVIAIFMAVMVTDIILLDIFNSLGMPTSTTVSMVFELLGATFVVALFKLAAPEKYTWNRRFAQHGKSPFRDFRHIPFRCNSICIRHCRPIPLPAYFHI